jgi:hypothetical protein
MKTAQYLVAGLVSVALIGSAGCFSYKKTETVEPPPSTTVVQPVTPSPTMESSSTSTTTSTATDSDGQSVEKQHSTTITRPGY